jgi:hypothetical protein
VSEQFLNVPYVRAAFQKVGGKGVAQAMNAYGTGYPGFQGGVFKYFLGGTDSDVAANILPGEKPLSRRMRQVFAKKGGGVVGKRGAAVFPSFALLYKDEFPLEINVLCFKRRSLAYPKPGGIHNH